MVAKGEVLCASNIKSRLLYRAYPCHIANNNLHKPPTFNSTGFKKGSAASQIIEVAEPSLAANKTLLHMGQFFVLMSNILIRSEVDRGLLWHTSGRADVALEICGGRSALAPRI